MTRLALQAERNRFRFLLAKGMGPNAFTRHLRNAPEAKGGVDRCRRSRPDPQLANLENNADTDQRSYFSLSSVIIIIFFFKNPIG